MSEPDAACDRCAAAEAEAARLRAAYGRLGLDAVDLVDEMAVPLRARIEALTAALAEALASGGRLRCDVEAAQSQAFLWRRYARRFASGWRPPAKVFAAGAVVEPPSSARRRARDAEYFANWSWRRRQ